MKQDRTRWNRKYDEDREMGPPSSLVTTFCHTAPGRLALDLAAGFGRNSLYLARQNFRVVAVDLADEAMRRLRALNEPNIVPVQADLDSFPLPPKRFDLVLCCFFLDRRLFPFLQESLKTGGILIYESARETDQSQVNQPRNRNYLLRSNELLYAFAGLRVLFYEEVLEEDRQEPGKLRSLARLVAQKGWRGDEALRRRIGSSLSQKTRT